MLFTHNLKGLNFRLVFDKTKMLQIQKTYFLQIFAIMRGIFLKRMKNAMLYKRAKTPPKP